MPDKPKTIRDVLNKLWAGDISVDKVLAFSIEEVEKLRKKPLNVKNGQLGNHSFSDILANFLVSGHNKAIDEVLALLK